MILDKRNGQVDRSLTLQTKTPASPHGQFRHVRLTPEGHFLVAHIDLGRVVEYDVDGRRSGRWRRRRRGRRSG